MSDLDPERSGRWSLPGLLRDAAVLGLVLLLVLVASRVALGRPLRLDFVGWATVYFALERPLLRGLGLTAVVGYWAELFAGDGPGLAFFAVVALYLLLRLGVVRLIGAGWVAVTSLAVVTTLGGWLLRLAIKDLLGPGAAWAVAGPQLPTAVLGAAVLGYPVFRLLAAVSQRFHVNDDFIFRSRSSW